MMASVFFEVCANRATVEKSLVNRTHWNKHVHFSIHILNLWLLNVIHILSFHFFFFFSLFFQPKWPMRFAINYFFSRLNRNKIGRWSFCCIRLQTIFLMNLFLAIHSPSFSAVRHLSFWLLHKLCYKFYSLSKWILHFRSWSDKKHLYTIANIRTLKQTSWWKCTTCSACMHLHYNTPVHTHTLNLKRVHCVKWFWHSVCIHFGFDSMYFRARRKTREHFSSIYK